MSEILGSNGSLSSFFSFISPLLDVCYMVLSVEVFGLPLWTILLNVLVCFTVIGFITKGSVGLGSVGNSVSAARRSSKSNEGKE